MARVNITVGSINNLFKKSHVVMVSLELFIILSDTTRGIQTITYNTKISANHLTDQIWCRHCTCSSFSTPLNKCFTK
jgi:hypothetical protein